MERQAPIMDPDYYAHLQKLAAGRDLAAALAARALNPYNDKLAQELWAKLHAALGADPTEVTPEQFLCPKVKKALVKIMGKERAEEAGPILELLLEGQFSSSPWRRSYRSRHFAYYAYTAVEMLCRLICQAGYRETLRQRLTMAPPRHGGYRLRLALGLRRKDPQLVEAVKTALLGEDPDLQPTEEIIQAVILSGNEELVEALCRLLLAARLQEGLRSAILEAADLGSIRTLTRFLKLCLEEDLFRYSSALRAFDVWSGMGFDIHTAATARKAARYAWDCLTDEATRLEYEQSEDSLKVYYALWALGCREVAQTEAAVERLLGDEKHYRRVLGWYFVSHTDHSPHQMRLASRYLEERDPELMAWVVSNLAQTNDLLLSYPRREPGVPAPNPSFPADPEQRRQLFARLEELAKAIGGKKRTFAGSPFDHVSVTLEAQPVYGCMLSLAGYDMDEELILRLLDAAPGMTAFQRKVLIEKFLRPEIFPAHRTWLREAVNDRSVPIRELAVSRLGECPLEPEDLPALAQGLRSKSSRLRKAITSVLARQPEARLRPLVTRLLASPEEHQLQAAIELLTEQPNLAEENRGELAALSQKELSTQTRILLDQLTGHRESKPLWVPENGFGLYSPAVVEQCHAGLTPEQEKKPGLLTRLLSLGELKALLPDWAQLNEVLGRLDQVFVRHADYEYEILRYDGGREKQLFGAVSNCIQLPADTGLHTLLHKDARPEMLPFWEEFREALGEYLTDIPKLLGLYFVTARYADPGERYRHLTPGQSGPAYAPWFLPIQLQGPAPQFHNQSRTKYTRYWMFQDMIHILPLAADPHRVYTEALRLYLSAIRVIGEQNLGREYVQPPKKQDPAFLYFGRSHPAAGINHPLAGIWRELLNRLSLSREDEGDWFTRAWRLEKLSGVCTQYGLPLEKYLWAWDQGIIPLDVVTEFLLSNKAPYSKDIAHLSNPARFPRGRSLYEQYPPFREPAQALLRRLVEVEARRGELPTALTERVITLDRLEGAELFCRLLAALGRESFFRGYEYSFLTDKKAVLSRLLKRCYPAGDDTPEKLASLLKQTDIREGRLAEAVMYAPQWAGFAEEILGWPGLKSGVWFFHAHINESFSAEKETETAIYSPISPQQFNDGAFDRDWFLRAYGQLGEERFRILYKHAKYITSGGNQHRRSQLYTDAVLGKLDIAQLEQEITEKRNQEKLRCYPLIPLNGDPGEALRRYEFIQKYLKESRQFGAQRRESEKKACATALENLAITTGILDVNRMTWQMETEKLNRLRPLMEPVTIDGVTLRLTIDDRGDAALMAEKGGKALKTPPKALSKNETYLTLKATAKELRELKRRSKDSLERAMTELTQFRREELVSILENPVLRPMLEALVWRSGSSLGFPRLSDTGLSLLTPEGTALRPEEHLTLAHPHHLRQAGTWHSFMGHLYASQIIQPFKQVFREYYPLTQEERQEVTVSRRYAGHQVQPQRAAALLKGRGWTVDYEQGLQRVYYSHDLIVRLYALADWFSPADIEPPTLETVAFFRRSDGSPVALADVPPVLFSEAMRDLDLAVSVAHAGGVDPEASHSTLEMRAAIAKELAGLLGLTNVTWIGSHARIQGRRATYSLHLGSGITHAEGIGMLNLLPVHSQSRGRIFLPFADDDPKTAEIMSKLLLLSQDQKIKDPALLRQLEQ